ncbi:MAG TPA: GNAT family N-acetyltransferase [Bryobacteraceae bacterium]|nr:GNAT family N-acetyltransferase [Bryobacteraceae bacterium]
MSTPSQIEKLPAVPASAPNSARVELLEASNVESIRDAWNGLAARAIVPNPFYEPWMALPALKHLAEKSKIYFLLIHGPANTPDNLWGLFPLEVRAKCLHLPIRALSFWQHQHCFLAAPLIDRDHAAKAIELFWRWFENNPLRCRVLDTNYFPGDGDLQPLWTEYVIGRCALALNEHPRGLQDLSGGFEKYSTEISNDQRRSYRRRERHMVAFSPPEYRQVESADELEHWIDDFLRLEASGWKGRAGGGAFALNPRETAFFRDLARSAFEQRHAWFFSLRLAGKNIAMIETFFTGGQGFGFKSAYDEEYSRFSPGVSLQMEFLRRISQEPGVSSVDTCAAPRHSLFNAFSNRRRIIRRSLYSDGSAAGDLIVSALPLLRWAKHRLRPNSVPDYLRRFTARASFNEPDHN